MLDVLLSLSFYEPGGGGKILSILLLVLFLVDPVSFTSLIIAAISVDYSLCVSGMCMK